jgi:CDP-archaeol synthase
MAGDCVSSFIKRRSGLEPSSMMLGLDQVPESLFPAVACSAYLPLGPLDIALIVLVFSVGELAMSRLFFAVGLRDRPYCAAHKLVQRDLWPIVEAHWNHRGPRPH